jgi:hypothetical protein
VLNYLRLQSKRPVRAKQYRPFLFPPLLVFAPATQNTCLRKSLRAMMETPDSTKWRVVSGGNITCHFVLYQVSWIL